MKKLSDYPSKKDIDLIKKNTLVAKVSKDNPKCFIVKDRESIDELVDDLLVNAYKILYDKNIKIIDFSLSRDSLDSEAYLTIDIDSLDDKNKVLINVYAQRNMIKLTNENGDKKATFSVKVDNNMDTEELSKTFETWANSFFFQDVLYGKMSIEESNKEVLDTARRYGFILKSIGEIPMEDLPFFRSMEYFDYMSGNFFATEELAKKHNEYVRIVGRN